MKIDWNRYRLRVTRLGLEVMALILLLAAIVSAVRYGAPFLNAHFGLRVDTSISEPSFWLGIGVMVFTSIFGLWITGARRDRNDA